MRVLILLIASLALAAALEAIGLPAGALLGPMAVAIVMAVRGTPVAIPGPLFLAGQAIVGLLIARAITLDIVATVATNAWLFAGVTLATLAASAVIGWSLSRWQVLPGTVAIWGSMPGAATAMVLMARAFGADERLVAVMTYARVVCVATLASILAAVLTGHIGAADHAPFFAAIDPVRLLATLAVAAIGTWIGTLTRVPASALIGPMLLGAVLNIAGVLTPELPPWLLAPSYAVIGWRIGFGFSREIVTAAAAALPRLLLSIVVLIGFSFGIALLLAHFTKVDLVTAYLATSPGGMDSVAIIAASTPVDVPFVMALQLLRFVAVLAAGPTLARWLAVRQAA